MSTAPEDNRPLPPREDWLRVIRDAPLVSIDLIVRDAAGRVLMGLRENEPARGTWFVPGGAIRKGETLDTAFTRIARNEFGAELQRAEARLLGVYEHHYPTNFVGTPGIGTHYVVLAHLVDLAGDAHFAATDQQHKELRWFSVNELMARDDVHDNVKAYFPETGPTARR